MTEAPAGVARLLPEVAEGLAGRPLVADDRGAVFRDVIAALAAFASVPGVLVLDDYQWASGDTAALTERLLAELDRPLLVVLTVRTGVAAPAQAAQLAEVLRAAPATALQLVGLDAHDLSPVAAELRTLTGRSASDAQLARLLHARTGGHPYFVGEIVRDARRSGELDLTKTPAGRGCVVRARLDALAPDEADVIEHAAVVGDGLRPGAARSLVERQTTGWSISWSGSCAWASSSRTVHPGAWPSPTRSPGRSSRRASGRPGGRCCTGGSPTG